MDEYLRPTEVMDCDHPEVRNLARALADGVSDPTAIAKRSFEWVRDEIRHSGDFQVNQPTCAASEVLRHKAGWCYAKSHLLAALLRANGIPAGLCYQRLAMEWRDAPLHAARLECRSIARIRVVQNRSARRQARGGRSVRSPERSREPGEVAKQQTRKRPAPRFHSASTTASVRAKPRVE